MGGLGLAALLPLSMVITVFVALALASAFGAVSYWLLVRGLLAPFLSRGSLLLTIAACEVAMLLTALVPTVAAIPRDPLAPTLWWLGFSTSLYVADRRSSGS
jgi:branched-subunit amino acid ABC-type transport system permease component